jgi:hypothetical protein
MSAAEAALAKGPLAAPLAAGVEQISQNQEITFTRYVKVILPADGFVFWVRSGLLGPSALVNASAANESGPNQSAPLGEIETRTVKGSLHYSTDQVQREDETYGLNKVVFTSLEKIDEFNEVSPQVMWLGTWQGIRFSFSMRGMFYQQADLHHYIGEAVIPAISSQIIDDIAGFDTIRPVVSNSLPIWLTLNAIMPVYPSFLVDENIVPPFASIHIDPSRTTALQAVPYLDSQSSHWQLASDHVRVTIYGLRNASALDYLDYVLGFMRNSEAMGLQNMPIVRDEKRTQDELTVLAMKKTIEFQVDYHQHSAREIGRKFILSCIPTLTFGD